MNEWAVVVDSSADIRSETYDMPSDIDLISVPLKILVGAMTFTDDDTLDVSKLIAAMRQEKKQSLTACPAPGQFLEAYRGHKKIICICMTGKLSGTYNASRLAAEMYLEEDPEVKIHCVDSKSTGGSIVLLAQKAMELIRSGEDFDAIAEKMDEFNTHTSLVALLGGYENLVKAGRMSAFMGKVAEHLNIKAVIAKTAEGTIDIRHKARGLRQAYRMMAEDMKETKDMRGRPIIISHCNNESGALLMRDLLVDMLETGNIEIMKCCGLTSFYVMESGIIIGY